MATAEPPLVFVDLDDTLFQSGRKIAPERRCATAARDRDGEPICFLDPARQRMVAWLLESAEVVPVTARSVEAFRRVELPFRHGAICSHGAVMIDNMGEIDPGWHRGIARLLAPWQPRLLQLGEQIGRIAVESQLPLRHWSVIEQGVAIYHVVKQNSGDDRLLVDLLQQLRPTLDQMALKHHLNGNNLALMPQPLDKSLAVEAWLERRGGCDRPLLAFGDSLTDLPFMQRCHWWATPAGSQIERAVQW